MGQVLEIESETAQIIQRRAHDLGIAVDEYLRRLLPPDEKDLGLRPTDPISEDEFWRDMEALGANPVESHYDGPYSREDIYFDHD